MAYTAPTIADFRTRYPAFAATADATVQLWLDEGDTETEAWPDDVRARAVMLYAAHKLTEADNGAAQGAISFKSGMFSATLSDSAASRTGLAATIYGREYLDFARRHFSGPRLAWAPPLVVGH